MENITQLRSLVRHAIDEASARATGPVTIDEVADSIMSVLFTHIPKHRRQEFIARSLAWEAEYSVNHPEGVR